MEPNKKPQNNKVSTELLNALAKTVVVFHDTDLNEAYNRIEIQVGEYEKSGEPCDLTYLRDLINQYSDKISAMCRTKNEMIKMMENSGMLNKLGLSPQGVKEDGDEDGDGKKPKATKKIGFRS